jgi:8-oxo-dGTP pyrophosphatase MutT (NUDIX family)
MTLTTPIEQACAVPLRASGDTFDVCLITSMGRGRWIFPKGVVDPGETHAITALKEALEEAGVEGRLLEPSLGQYRDSKWNAPLSVTVFAMSVERTHETWLEQGLRRRRWASLDEARELVADPTLREMLDLAVRRLREER